MLTSSESQKNEPIIDKYMKYLEKSDDKKSHIQIINSKKPIVRTSLLTIIFALIISSCFLIKIYTQLNIEEFLNLIIDYYDFHDKRNYYLLNSILLFKLYVITSKQEIYPNYTTFLNNTIYNEEKISSFILKDSYLNFDKLIYDIDTMSICDFYITNSKLIQLSNNVTVLDTKICSQINSNDTIHKIFDKSLTEIINYIINYLDSKNNDLFMMSSKQPDNIKQFLKDDEFEIIQILAQYVVRQSIAVIVDKIHSNYNIKMKEYYEICIVLFIIFLIFLCLGLVTANYLTYMIFNSIKKINNLIVSILPNEFIIAKLNEKEVIEGPGGVVVANEIL